MARGIRVNSPWMVAFLVGFLYASFLALKLDKSEQDWSAFIIAGSQFVNPSSAPAGLAVIRDSAGYDGQFYYRLALSPFTNEETDFGIRLDNPRFRQQRIVYPLLARTLSIGRIDLIPFSLVLVNFLALCFIGWLGARYAQLRGQHAFWGFAFALYPGFLFTLSRDTTEIVAALMMLASILYLTLRRELLAFGFLILAILTKETALILAVGLLAAATLTKLQWRNARMIIAVGSIFSFLIWQLWLSLNWITPFSLVSPLGTAVGPPFLGLGHFLAGIFPPENHFQYIWLIELFLLAVSTFVILVMIGKSKAESYLKLSWLIYAALMISFTRAIWVEDWSFLRILFEMWFLSVIIAMESPRVAKHWFLVIPALSWLPLAIDIIQFR